MWLGRIVIGAFLLYLSARIRVEFHTETGEGGKFALALLVFGLRSHKHLYW